ncbi:oligosaccharide flippase family protein [Acetobacterium fimetarium]|uniref:Oligosaccharide flippase family protein n=1 Tax=Acetobacterium fimetarium TaxID=52691 RepID=A0ABR6WY83_9FIRM|nr:lipopolysaccharide biosynthesis protein [Acetobacterium fimetarium]MBC3805610.1 oligosaccharide flippase family protein [Acetobacterium fimetarium]
MNENNIKNKAIYAGKWSLATEAAAKLVSPISNMVLARILSPEAFGVVAIATMIMSFADMFTDAGFQKYLIQHEFRDDEEKYQNTNVAFWTNLGISFFLWAIIILFRNPIATMVGNPGLGNVIAIACVQLLLTSFSSIQMALYRRDFDFKTLFLVRMVAICVPFTVTIPLALSGLSYWSIIIGSIVAQLTNAVILTIKSKWKPFLFYKIAILKEMFSFSIWSLIEAISIWATSWIDAFIIGSYFNSYYLGLYKTSQMMVNALMALVVSAIIPVLFSTLSRLQNDEINFRRTYFKMQRLVSVLVFPIGIGIYVYRDLATEIILGSQWREASEIMGIWALTSAVMIVLGHFCSEVYRAKGKPKLSFLAQVLHLVFLVPVIVISSKFGFWVLIYARSLVRMQFVLVHFLIMKFAMGFPILETIKNVFPTAISAIIMGILGYYLQQLNPSIIWRVFSIVICALFYFGMLSLFKDVRNEIVAFARRLIQRA